MAEATALPKIISDGSFEVIYELPLENAYAVLPVLKLHSPQEPAILENRVSTALEQTKRHLLDLQATHSQLIIYSVQICPISLPRMPPHISSFHMLDNVTHHRARSQVVDIAQSANEGSRRRKILDVSEAEFKAIDVDQFRAETFSRTHLDGPSSQRKISNDSKTELQWFDEDQFRAKTPSRTHPEPK